MDEDQQRQGDVDEDQQRQGDVDGDQQRDVDGDQQREEHVDRDQQRNVDGNLQREEDVGGQQQREHDVGGQRQRKDRAEVFKVAGCHEELWYQKLFEAVRVKMADKQPLSIKLEFQPDNIMDRNAIVVMVHGVCP